MSASESTPEGRLLEGAVVAVVGGGRGIGRAHALACARAGASVLVNDLGCDLRGEGTDPSVAEAVASEIRAMGARGVADHTDVGTASGPERVVQRAVEQLGRLDGLINAAGLFSDATLLKLDDDLLDRLIDVQIRGAFRLTRAAARAMIEAKRGGSIVLHTGPAAFFGASRQSALAATSAAVVGLARSAAIELRRHGIRVNAIAPTARTRTTEHHPLFAGMATSSMSPEFVAPVGTFLLSPLAEGVSGEVVGAAGTRIYCLHGRETPGWFGLEPRAGTPIRDTGEPSASRSRGGRGGSGIVISTRSPHEIDVEGRRKPGTDFGSAVPTPPTAREVAAAWREINRP